MESTEKLDFLPYILVFVRRWKTLVGHFVFIVMVAVVYAFFVAKVEFKSSITFLPPQSASTSLGSLIPGLSLPSVTSSDVMPEQIEPIFGSSSLRRQVIDRFDLYKNYKLTKSTAKFKLALKKLDKNLVITPIDAGDMAFNTITAFSISAYHTSPDTALLMAKFSFLLLDSTVQNISSDLARRSRIFIETQLDNNIKKLDSLQVAMEAFQRENKAYDIPEQLKMTVAAYAELKSTLLANEIRLQALKSSFGDETPEVESLRKSNAIYIKKLQELELSSDINALPSLNASTHLLPKYANLLRENEVQTQLILLLTKEFEQSKIKEAKNVSALMVTDAAYKPEYKDRPKRLFVMLAIVVIYMGIISVFWLYQSFYQVRIKNSIFFNNIKKNF